MKTRVRATRRLLATVVVALLLFAAAVMPGPAQGADPPRFGADDVPTLFYISKSENRNRVDFGIKLDGGCQPRSDEPVFPYWRMFEEHPVTLEGLSFGEPRGYGIARQRVHDRSPDGTWVHVELRAMQSRTIEVLALRNSSGRCTAAARMTIAGAESHLHHVHVQLRGGIISRPRWLELRGRTVGADRPVSERLDP